jgi:hypothetical protein
MLSVIGPANATPVDSVKKTPATRVANAFLLVNNVIILFLPKLMVILTRRQSGVLFSLSIDVSLALYSMGKNNIIKTQPHGPKGILNVGAMTDRLCFGTFHSIKSFPRTIDVTEHSLLC